MGELARPDSSKYLKYVAGLNQSEHNAPISNANELYPQILHNMPNGSVTILSIGFLTNLRVLLQEHRDLVQKKVSRLVIMAGRYDDGFNLVRHDLTGTSRYVIENWPTPLVISDFGADVRTGFSLKETDKAIPVREAYYRLFDQSFGDRASWDQIAVLYAVRGTSAGFEEVTEGEGRMRSGYVWRFREDWRLYARATQEPEFYRKEIERLMTVEPSRP